MHGIWNVYEKLTGKQEVFVELAALKCYFVDSPDGARNCG
jgi:hypothetical protein